MNKAKKHLLPKIFVVAIIGGIVKILFAKKSKSKIRLSDNMEKTRKESVYNDDWDKEEYRDWNDGMYDWDD